MNMIFVEKGMCRILGLLIAITACNASAQTYPAPVLGGPSSSPAFPAAFAPFNPPVTSATPASGTPDIAEWTRANNGGDTMALTGDNLGSDFVFYTETGGTAAGMVELLDGMEAAVKLPSSVGSRTFALMWGANTSGYGRPVPINGTDAWWVGPVRAARGQTFSVYGENLGLNGTCYLYIEGHGWIESDHANPYKADFTVPSGLGNGDYTVWAHNGQGREYGWTRPLTLEVYDGPEWNDNSSTWIYVQRDHGAMGDGTTDDSGAIKDALAAADASAGSTVYFEPGTYRINSSIVDSISDVRIKGAGVNETVLVEKVGGIGTDLLDLNADRCEISDMTIETDVGSIYNKNLLDLSGSVDLVLRRLVVSQLPNAANSPDGSAPVALPEEYLIHIIDCIFHVGSPVLIKNSNQVFIDGCQFYALNDANSILYFGVAQEISIMNTTCGHYDFDAGLQYTGAGRYVLCNPGKGAPRNWYYSGNATVDFTTHTDNNNHNAAEDFMFESTDTEWYGTPVAVSGNVLTFTNLPSSVEGNKMYWIDYTATIVAGKGLGQARTVVAYDTADNTLTLDEPFRVQPDETSVIYFGFFARNIAIYNNHFDGNWSRVNHSDDPADAAVESYGGTHRLTVDGNTITDKETALYVHCRARPTVFTGENTPPPNYFGVYKNNVATNVQLAARLITTEHNQYLGNPLSPGVGHIGHVFRKNHFQNVTERAWNYEWRNTNPGMTLMVFDQNTANSYADDVGFEAVHNGSVSDTPPATIQNQVQQDAYLADAVEPPPPDGPPPPVLTGIAISGPTSVAEETTAQYTCTASWSDGTTTTVAPDWSDDSPHAAISGSGLLTAGNVTADQTVTVTAVYGSQTDTHTVTINYIAPVITGISISGSTSVDEETTAQYTCSASWSDGTTTTVTPTWSENSSYASINSSGVLDAGNVTADQSVTITASYGGYTDTHAVTINYVAPTLTSIAISGPTSVNEGATAQYSCTASWSDGTTTTVNPAWSENSAYASINVSGQLSAGDVSADQDVVITASFGGLTDTHAMTIIYVVPVLTGITISGPSSVNEGTSAQYTCTASWSDGTTTTVTPSWSENSAYATISASGLLNASIVSTDENVTITATFGGLSDTHALAIENIPPTLSSITVLGPTSVNEETTAQYTCTANWSDGTTTTINPTWSVNSPYASIDTSGELSAGNVTADQVVTVTASYSGKTDGHAVTISYVAPTLESITISGDTSIDEESSAQYTCAANWSDGTTSTVTPSWSVTSPYASISTSGELTAGDVSSDQNVTITATYSGQSDTHVVTINYVAPPVVLTGVSISGPAYVEENSTVNFTCTASYSDGTTAQVNPTWSENAAFASIASSGALTVGNIEADDTLTVTASYQGQTDSHALSVWMVGTRIVYPLSGFEGKTVRARLWDEVTETFTELGEMEGPDQLVIENVNADQWYWIIVEEYDEGTGEWMRVQANWINM